jgi:hypothetical protein
MIFFSTVKIYVVLRANYLSTVIKKLLSSTCVLYTLFILDMNINSGRDSPTATRT